MSEDLRILLGLYFSTTSSSILMNSILNIKAGREAKKKSIQKLKYKKGLTSVSKKELNYIDYYITYDTIVDIASSFIPGANVMLTVENIEHYKYLLGRAEQLDDEIIETVNAMEDYYRKNNIELLKNVRDRLKVIPEGLDIYNEEARISEKETKKIFRRNRLNYKQEMIKFRKEREV